MKKLLIGSLFACASFGAYAQNQVGETIPNLSPGTKAAIDKCLWDVKIVKGLTYESCLNQQGYIVLTSPNNTTVHNQIAPGYPAVQGDYRVPAGYRQ